MVLASGEVTSEGGGLTWKRVRGVAEAAAHAAEVDAVAASGLGG